MKDIIFINHVPYFTKNIVDIYPKIINKNQVVIAFNIKHQSQSGEVLNYEETYDSIESVNEKIKNILKMMECSTCHA